MASESFHPGFDQPREETVTDRYFVFAHRRILVQKISDGYIIPTGVDIESILGSFTDRFFIGTMGDTLCFSCLIDETQVPGDFAYEDLRTVYIASPDEWKPIMSAAVLVADWDENHRFCGRCGGKTKRSDTERCRTCPSCGHTSFPRISPAIIVAILKDNEILLAHNRRFTAPLYSLIAGFVETGEDLKSTVKREVKEETGLEIANIRYFGSQCWPFPDSLMVGFVADYLSGEVELEDELVDAGWFAKDSMPSIPSYGTISRRIIDWFLETGGDGALPEDQGPEPE